MKLNENFNYIISGIERSGTSMLMQIINAGEIPLGFDNARPADMSNPKGYYELEGGKIINKLMQRLFPFENYKGKFIKITAFGLKFLPPGKYKIIYSERDIEEVLDSMEKMIGNKDTNREETKISFLKLNDMIKKSINERDDIEVLFINYNEVLSDPKNNIKKIIDFLEISDEILEKMVEVVDNRLYRQRRK